MSLLGKREIGAALTQIRQREKLPYDGVYGTLPSWVPLPLKHEFRKVRGRLADQYDHADVLEWLASFRALRSREVYQRNAFFPAEHARDLEALTYIQDIVHLGPRAGLQAYLGKGNWKVLRGQAVQERDSARRKKGSYVSAKVRKQRSAERDRRIHDARASGKFPKQIANDEELPYSTVTRILRAPRPR